MPAKRVTRRYTFEQFTAIRRYQPVLAFSPDGSQLAYSTNTSGQFNLWRQSSEGGYPHQLTTYTEQAVRQIAWSPDGRFIAYAGNDRQPTDMDVLVRNIRTGEVRRALAGGAYYIPLAWSPRWSRGPGAARLPVLRSVSILGQPGHWGAGAQHPRLQRLRQDLPETDSPRLGRRGAERLGGRRARGVDVRYDVYQDEGHGFTKRENELKALRATAEFFEKYLLPEGQ